MTDELEARGWNAIDGALRRIYGDREPKHYGTVLPFAAGGGDPIDGVSVYKRTDGTCHWHYVTYGFSELYQKESDDPERSGYGFELTFRLACRPEDDEPPMWPINLMQNLARYVFKTGNVFDAGHHLDANGPIALEHDTQLTALLFAADPELPGIDSPNGSVQFVQVIGITADELEAVQSWNSTSFTEIVAKTSPLLVTDLARRSILTDSGVAGMVAEGTERDGSSTSRLFMTIVRWEKAGPGLRLTLDAVAAAGLARQLRSRLLHDQPLWLIGKGHSDENLVVFEPGADAAVAVDEDGLTVTLPRTLADRMSKTLRPIRGSYSWPELEGFELVVVPAEIKDRDGKKIIRVVG